SRPFWPHRRRHGRDRGREVSQSAFDRATGSVDSPPPCGEGLGVGVEGGAKSASTGPPPSLTLPHKGGGNRPNVRRRVRVAATVAWIASVTWATAFAAWIY